MKQFLFLFALISLIIFRILIFAGHHSYGKRPTRQDILSGFRDSIEFATIRQKAHLLPEFARTLHCHQRIFFLADMRLPSGKNRFFIYDLSKDSIISSGLVAHGHGNNGFSFSPIFSNRPGSSCTALGKYKIGKIYRGNFGPAYRLFGLDSSNNNAIERNIVLHGHDCVPDREPYPDPICNSSGCVMVSPAFLSVIRSLLDTATRPVLLWVFQ
jgi:L,D-transpeptidase catalytic domain